MKPVVSKARSTSIKKLTIVRAMTSNENDENKIELTETK
jgi:hypothetical protein